MPPSVVHVEISATDQARITDFYSRLFGRQVNADNPPMSYGLANTKDGELGIDSEIYQINTKRHAGGPNLRPAG